MGPKLKKILFITTIILFFAVTFIMVALPDLKANELAESTEKFIYTDDGRSDPFISLLSSEGLIKESGLSSNEEMSDYLKNLKVSGIMWDETMPVIMINKKMHKVGDVVEHLTIKEINVNSVILEYKTLTHEIVLIKKKKINDQGGIQ